jgi:hypothetical protein
MPANVSVLQRNYRRFLEIWGVATRVLGLADMNSGKLGLRLMKNLRNICKIIAYSFIASTKNTG